VTEFASMLFLVYVGCGSACMNSFPATSGGGLDPAWVLSVSLTFGLVIAALVLANAHNSESVQINCAVTLALVVSKELSATQGLMNFIAQLLGSVAGASLLLGGTAGTSGASMTPRDFTGQLGANSVNPRYGVGNAFVSEAMMTFLLVWVVFDCAVNKNSIAQNNAPLAVGFVVFVAHTVCIPVTGCSINPTRSFGPAFVSWLNDSENVWADHWVFWLGPLCGALAAATFRGYTVVNHVNEVKHAAYEGQTFATDSKHPVPANNVQHTLEHSHVNTHNSQTHNSQTHNSQAHNSHAHNSYPGNMSMQYHGGTSYPGGGFHQATGGRQQFPVY